MSLQLTNEAKSRHPFKTTHGVDCKAWAKQIIYRFERNDKDLLAVQILFAQMALNIKQQSN